MYLYWITNNRSINTFDQSRYTLFYPGETTRMLTTGEYVIYTDIYKKNYEILGEGTQLTRNTINNEWSVNVIDSSSHLMLADEIHHVVVAILIRPCYSLSLYAVVVEELGCT